MKIAPDNVARRRGNRVKPREFLGVIGGAAVAWQRGRAGAAIPAPPNNKQSRPASMQVNLEGVKPVAASAEKGLACRDWRPGIPGERRTDGAGWIFPDTRGRAALS